MIKANFSIQANITPTPTTTTKEEEFRRKALENLGGSMVFVERNKLTWDGAK